VAFSPSSIFPRQTHYVVSAVERDGIEREIGALDIFAKDGVAVSVKLPFAQASVKASPLRFDPLGRRLTPTIDRRSAAGPNPYRPERRTLPFWPVFTRISRHACVNSPNLMAALDWRIQADIAGLFRSRHWQTSNHCNFVSPAMIEQKAREQEYTARRRQDRKICPVIVRR
jgi:hypothetical protein